MTQPTVATLAEKFQQNAPPRDPGGAPRIDLRPDAIDRREPMRKGMIEAATEPV